MTQFVLATALALGFAGGASAQQKPQPTTPKKAAVATARPTESQPGLAAEAKVKANDARSTALKAVPGKVTSEKIEKRGGRLLYVFMIQPPSGKVRDVLVDANTGQVVHAKRRTAPKKAPAGTGQSS